MHVRPLLPTDVTQSTNTAVELWLIQYYRSLTSMRFCGIESSLITARNAVVLLEPHEHEFYPTLDRLDRIDLNRTTM